MPISAHAMVLLAPGALILAGAPDRAPGGTLPGETYAGWTGPDGVPGFEENRSQLEGPARFVARGRGFVLSLETAGAVMDLGGRDPAAGVVRVSPSWEVDFPIQSLDTYASPAEPRSVLVSYSGLPAGTYTVTLEVEGTHGSRSRGSWVWIDGINVLGAVPALPVPIPAGSPAPSSAAGGSTPSSPSPETHKREPRGGNP